MPQLEELCVEGNGLKVSPIFCRIFNFSIYR